MSLNPYEPKDVDDCAVRRFIDTLIYCHFLYIQPLETQPSA